MYCETYPLMQLITRLIRFLAIKGHRVKAISFISESVLLWCVKRADLPLRTRYTELAMETRDH